MAFENRTEIDVKVHVKRLEGLPRRSVRSPNKRRWYATLSAGAGQDMKTQTRTRHGDGTVTWDETFTVTIPTKSVPRLRVAIFCAHEYFNDEKTAFSEVDLDPVKMSRTKEISITLQHPRSAKKDCGQLVVSVQVQLPEIERSQEPKDGQLLAQFAKISQVSPSWHRFLAAFQQAAELARQIAVLDPTAKVAVGVISFALAAVVKQVERDQRINELQEMMSSLLLFFRDIESLQKSKFLCDVLDRLLRQVSECTYFILQYQKIELFAERAAVHLVNDTDELLKQFFGKFAVLRAELAIGTSLQTAMHIEYILNKVNEIGALLHIHPLKHLEESGWRTDKQCASNTRAFTINRVHRWVSSFDKGLFVLSGAPGSGKSPILHTVAGALDRTKRLGAGIFLNEYTIGKKTADILMRTIVYYLGLSNPRLGQRIAAEISQRPHLDSADAARYGELLVQISEDLVLYGPVTVIVDGLHELETQHDQEVVRNVLAHVARVGHDHLRFIISSRDWNLSPDQGSTCWDLTILDCSLGKLEYNEAQVQTALDELLDQEAIGGYTIQELKPLISHHINSFGCSPRWISSFREVVMDEPQSSGLFLDELLSSTTYPITEEEAFKRVLAASSCLPIYQLRLNDFTVLDHDLLWTSPGSKLFSQSCSQKELSNGGNECILNHELYELGYLVKSEISRVPNFSEYDIAIPPTITRSVNATANLNPPLLPITGSPFNIYQICLREGSTTEKRGPVYARCALPASEPLFDGRNIKWVLGSYGVSSSDLDRMLAKSPPEGCEWIILHHGLFPFTKQDSCTTVTITTPALTQAILERLASIWACWSGSVEEGTCLRLRDNVEESKFLAMDSFSKITYHETHAELVCEGEKKGDLIPGDQLQVRRTAQGYDPWAMIALALRY